MYFFHCNLKCYSLILAVSFQINIIIKCALTTYRDLSFYFIYDLVDLFYAIVAYHMYFLVHFLRTVFI